MNTTESMQANIMRYTTPLKQEGSITFALY
jgi:hypothetical protein